MKKQFQEQALPRRPQSRLEQLWGTIPTVTVEPTYVPRNVSEQLVIWDDTAGSGDMILSIYNTRGNAWLGVTLTAL